MFSLSEEERKKRKGGGGRKNKTPVAVRGIKADPQLRIYLKRD